MAERRLVSVLFADLVGFTALSEHRDPEEIRELLSRYFDRCRALIERYGGTVEKFIGDAVMAVWGSPVAREDDAERAVRAALALEPAVAALGEEAGLPDLRVRAGVLTGRAAVERGAEAEGMVLGDTVNTASRLQGLAPPGEVLVDDVTRRATEAAIAYEDAGTHHVKGRDQPVRAWRALRVVALVGGARRETRLEAPFVGRERELATIVGGYERTLHEGRARLVCVTGPAGSGKSRLDWEFTKYLDGISHDVLWHTGRCLSYGEGVAYTALADMVRTRAKIAEDEPAGAAREKLAATVAQYVTDDRERTLVEPRLAHLLGLERRAATDRADLFSGWRLFFERLAAHDPVVLVFEDLQWADSGLLEFVDHLLEWSADLPIFMLALARPELLERRPEWTRAPDRIELVRLGPLAPDAVDELLDGLVPGVTPELRARIGRQAEGVPLYAVETVRMLLDRGALALDGDRYAVREELADLEVPETLHALVGARLDGLPQLERSLVQHASVLGQSFTASALAAIGDHPAAQLEAGLQALVAKQVLRVEDDPMSSDQGQYVFVQGILRTVAYETLSRRDRKVLHLATARHLRSTGGADPRLAEVLAAHELAAFNADPDAADAPGLRASARTTLAEAGERAISLALGDVARRYFEQAADLTPDPADRATLLARAGEAAATQQDEDGAMRLFESAAELLEAAGRQRDAAAVRVGIAEIHVQQGTPGRAIEILDTVLPDLGGTEDEVFAQALTKRARAATFDTGSKLEALQLTERALSVAEAIDAPAALADALVTRGVALATLGRHEEALALFGHSIGYAERHELITVLVRARYNLTEVLAAQAQLEKAGEEIERAIRFARERGDRRWEEFATEQRLLVFDLAGRWDELVSTARTITNGRRLRYAVPVLAERGEAELLERAVANLSEPDLDDLGLEDAAIARIARAAVARHAGDHGSAIDEAEAALALTIDESMTTSSMAFRQLRLAAGQAGDRERLAQAVARVEALPRGFVTRLLAAELALARAEVAPAAATLARAVDLQRSLRMPFGLAQALLGQGLAAREAGDERAAAPLLAEARATFEALGARNWIERVERSAAAAV